MDGKATKEVDRLTLFHGSQLRMGCRMEAQSGTHRNPLVLYVVWSQDF